MLANAIRAHLAEFGIVTAQGVNNVLVVIEQLTTAPTENEPLPDLVVAMALAPLVACLRDLRVRIMALEVELLRWHRSSETSRRLETIPGFGFVTATAMTATVPDPTVFKSGRGTTRSGWFGRGRDLLEDGWQRDAEGAA